MDIDLGPDTGPDELDHDERRRILADQGGRDPGAHYRDLLASIDARLERLNGTLDRMASANSRVVVTQRITHCPECRQELPTHNIGCRQDAFGEMMQAPGETAVGL